MAELSTNNSSESNHKLVNMKLIDRDHLEQSQYKRILIVDDNSDIAFTLCVELESDPVMKVYSYDSPVTALLDFKPNFYDLLLIDVNMPLMDGFQLAQKLLQKDLNVKICFMTAGEINMDAIREVHPRIRAELE
jgi:CheY-like chemotaxis protein